MNLGLTSKTTSFQNLILDQIHVIPERLSAHLFRFLEPKSWLLKKVRPFSAFGDNKTQLFDKSCVLYYKGNAHFSYGSYAVHFVKVGVGFYIYLLGWVELPKLPFNKGQVSSSVLQITHSPAHFLLIPLLCASQFNRLSSPLSSALCVSLSFLLSSVENLLYLLLLSSSSSAGLPL